MNSFKNWLIIKVKHLNIIENKRERERQEQERLFKEKLELEKLEQERLEQERLEKERLEKDIKENLEMYPHNFLKERKITNYSDFIDYFITVHNLDTEHLTYILKQPMELSFNSEYLANSEKINRTLLEVKEMHTASPRLYSDLPYVWTYEDFINDFLFFVENDNALWKGSALRHKYMFKPYKLLEQIIKHENRLDKDVYNTVPISVGDYGLSWGVNDGNHRICMSRFFNYKYLLTSWWKHQEPR